MKTAKQHTKEDASDERHLMRTYYGFMAFLAIMLLIILSSCATPFPHQIKTQSIVTYLHGQTVLSHSKQTVTFDYSPGVYYTDSLNTITIPRITFIGHNEAIGTDTNGIQWTIIVTNMKREPYFLALISEQKTIIVGTQPYKP